MMLESKLHTQGMKFDLLNKQIINLDTNIPYYIFVNTIINHQIVYLNNWCI